MLSGRALRGDRLLAGDQEPPLGSHLVTPRGSYLHHGIYVGARKVVHYSGLRHGLRRRPVEEVPFAHFARGQRVLVRSDAPSDFDVTRSSMTPSRVCRQEEGVSPTMLRNERVKCD